MKFKKPKVAVVLGGGGARGLAHIGVLKVLEENNIPIDLVVGTSMGAFIGGFYTSGISVQDMEKIAGSVNRNFVAKMLTPNLSISGLVDGNRIRDYLKTFIGDSNIEQLKIPFASVATNLNTGEEVVLDRGSVAEAIMASIAIPALFKPVFYQNCYLLDGGFVNPLPVSVAHKLGADVIIAVNVAPNPSKRINKNSKKKDYDVTRLNRTVSLLRKRLLNQTQEKVVQKNQDDRSSTDTTSIDENSTNPEFPSMLKSVMQSISIVEYSLMSLHLKDNKPDVLISPAVSEIQLLEFYRAKELIKAGYDSATQALSEIRSAIQEGIRNK